MKKVKTIAGAKNLIFYSFVVALPLAVWWALSVEITAATTDAIGNMSGFPITAPSGTDFSSPAVVDLDQDGDFEILTADSRGRVWGWNHKGDLLNNFPLDTKNPNCSDEERINGSLAVGNVAGDNKLEIVAGTRGCGTSNGKRGRIYVWDAAGHVLSGWPREMDWNSMHPDGTPEVHSVALGNFAGGSQYKEILVGTSNSAPNVDPDTNVDTRNLYIFNGDGSLVSQPTGYRTAGIWGAVAAANISGDEYDEAITGRDHVYMHIYNRNGQPLPNFPLRTPVDGADIDSRWGTYKYGEFTRGAPAIGDIDLDGVMEIAMPGDVRDPNDGYKKNNNALWVIESSGNRQSGFQSAPLGGASLTGSFKPMYSASLGDLTGDGKLEIVVPYASGEIHVYRPNGGLLWKYDYAQGKILQASEVVIGDVSGDGLPDVVFGTYAAEGTDKGSVRLIALHGLSGQMVDQFPLSLGQESGDKQGIRSAPTIADIDGDCDVDIFVSSWGGTLYGWDLKTPYYWNQMPWPTGRHDAQRTGSMSGPSSSNTSACPLPQPLTPQVFIPLAAR